MSDWNSVTIIHKRLPKGTTAKSKQVVNAAQRTGVAVHTQLKYGAATNKHPVTPLNTAKLDHETEELKHEKLPLDIGKLIQQGRNGLGMTQKDLSAKICEKPKIVNEYENGKAIPNQQILAKIEKVIGIKLRGKNKGQPLTPPFKKK
ncbi:endothelial differentiation-related factor 1 homolog [Artemia franciscana]|uniref:HTH cro/C1-type domain-containing protein n=1 Tax=Artemia franciscana TaxID=6661 RepID=A0AA88HZB3_ARTSF|nr:hypothetical protein QYM36_009350 [Artemia franciscana]